MEQNNLKADMPQAGEVETDLSNLQKSMPQEDFKNGVIVEFYIPSEKIGLYDGSELNQDR